ncbi:hypothetical protein F5Y17DRAFT_453389 [Xylariaceae sp. FL0594]|nr:hypothetical protein F5Y17DRAFT_453389 [Xylariaceae sp. FL0594]
MFTGPVARNCTVWRDGCCIFPSAKCTALDLDCTDRLRAIAESLKLTNDARNICNEKAWRFRRRSGEEVVARDVLAKISRWMNYFKAVVGTCRAI